MHVPFCARRCSYCDFAIAVRRSVPVAEYIRALRRELEAIGPALAELDTVYLGGGTPSRLGGDGIAAVLESVRSVATIARAAEVTMEANPDDVTEGDAAAWVRAGVGRVSLGAQSFSPEALRWMHRTHDALSIGEAVRALRSAGIANVSLDLIFALPPAVRRDWERDVDAALALAPEHLSLYGLTVEPHTPLGNWYRRGDVVEAPEERYEAEYLLAHERLTRGGLVHYEVSNFARAGYESRHNSAYWSGARYAGAGPSAHSFDGVRRWWNVASYAGWLRAATGGTPVAGSEILSPENRAAERVYLGLRTSRGLRASAAELDVAAAWRAAGWVEVRDRTIVPTPAGWLRLDALAAALTAAGSY